jgi:O-antigen ligase
MLNKSILQKVYLWTLIFVAVTLPTKWIQLNSFFIIVLFIIWLLDGDFVVRLKKTVSESSFIILTSFFFISVISLIYTSNLTDGFLGIETKISLFTFPLFILGPKRLEKSEIEIVLISFLASCVFVSLLCLGDTVYMNYLKGVSYSYSTSWSYSADNLIEKWGFHPSYFSTYCGFCVFITISLIRRGKVKTVVGIFLIIYLSLFQMLLASRVGIFASLLVITFSLIYEAYQKGKLLKGMILAFMILIVSLVSLYNFGTMKDKVNAMLNYKVNMYNEAFKIDGRLNQWKASIDIVKKHFVFGVGIGDRKDELQKEYVKSEYIQGYKNKYDSHNLFLEAAVTTGIFLFIQAIKRRQSLYLQFLILFLMLSMVEASLSVQKGVVFFSFINTILFTNSKVNES